MSVLVLRKDNLAKLEIKRGLIITVLIPLITYSGLAELIVNAMADIPPFLNLNEMEE